MRHVLGLLVSLGVVGVCLIPASALAQAQKAEAPEAVAPFKPVPAARQPPNPGQFLASADRNCRHFFRMEFHFIDQVCSPTPEQARAIAGDGEKALQKMILKNADDIFKARQEGNSSRTGDLEIREAIRRDLAEIVKNRLTAEQAKRFRNETQKRTADWRRAGVAAIVELIDAELFLSPTQRDEIRRSLDRNWRGDWCPSPDLLLSFPNVSIPAIPDECVEPSLTVNQRNAWKKLPKGLQSHLAVGIASASLRLDTPPEDDVLREAREASNRSKVKEDAR